MSKQVVLENISDDEFQDLTKVHSGEITQSAYRKKWRHSHSVTQKLLEELETKRENLVADADSGVLTGDVLDEITFNNEVWSALERYQQAIHSLRTERSAVSRSLSDDEPVLIVWQSDLHLGHVETMYRKLRQDCEIIRNTPGMYVILGGDLIDNVVTGVSARGMHHEQLTTIHIQKYLAEELTEYLGPENVLAMLLGNHDEWSEKSDDFDPIGYLAHKIGCPYLGAWGTINLGLGDESYSILCAHQFRMRSSFNLTHSAKRFWDFLGNSEIDAVMMGHTHEAASETAPKQQRYMFFGQAGSYLRTSRYGRRLGFGDSLPHMPGVLLWPDSHTALGIHDAFEHGPWMLAAARNDYQARKSARSKKKAA